MTLESELSTEHFPSMDPATTSWCFDCKRNDRSSRLLKEDGAPVLCCEGKNVPCDGNWKDPGSKEQCSSSASKVRASHCKQGPFQPSCKSCCKAHFTDKLKYGRSHHHFAPHLKNNSDPRFDSKTSNSNKKHSHPERVLKSDSPAPPMESKAMHNRVINSSHDHKLQFGSWH